MQILNIKGKKWMVGLEWEILPGDSTIKQEAKEVATKTESNFGIIVDHDSFYAIGLTKKITKDPSAAIYLALANQYMRENGGVSQDYPDWIVLEEVGDDKYWMGVIKSGIPAPQFDAVLSITEIKDRMTELLINDTYTVYTSAGELISIFDGIKHIENKGLNDLTEDVKTKIKFTKLLGIPNSVMYAAAGFIVLCVAGYVGSQFMEGRNIKEKAALLAEKQEREKREKQQKYEADIKNYEKTKTESEQKELDNVVLGLSGNPAQILTAFYENIGSTEIGTHGWSLKTIECYFDVVPQSTAIVDPNAKYPRIACDYLYERNPLATTRMLLEDYPNAKLNGDKAVVTKEVQIDPVYITKADKSILDSVKLSKDWGFDVQSQLQLLKVANIDHEIKGSTELTYKNQGKPITPAEAAAGRQPNPEEVNKLGIGVGEITIKGSTFDWVKELADNVDFTGTGLRKVRFEVKSLGEFNWEAKFNYYVKTKDGGIGSSSSVGLGEAEQVQKAIGQPTLNQAK
jgi:hypothetical protein